MTSNNNNVAVQSRTPSKRRSNPSSKPPQTSQASQTSSLESFESLESAEPSRKAPRTPPKRLASARIVTPSSSSVGHEHKKDKEEEVPLNARRALQLSPIKDDDSENKEVNENKENKENKENEDTEEREERDVAKTNKKLPFGHTQSIQIPKNVQKVYQIVHKHSGNIGGNGHGGAIYGELTVGSMQKMTNLMMEHTGLGSESRFIDVGCGLGKPNLHVAQYPGVEFSYGIEMEEVRWMLGIVNLGMVLREAVREVEEKEGEGTEIGHRCHFAHGDITEAEYFDPFTHVYMFDIGFPPRLFHQLSDMFNRSKSEYLICYHGPKLMIDTYEFDVELIVQTPTSMHGSSEVHTGYIYRRVAGDKKKKSNGCKNKRFGVPCDPLFADAWELCQSGLEAVSEHSANQVAKQLNKTKRRTTRSSKKLMDQNK